VVGTGAVGAGPDAPEGDGVPAPLLLPEAWGAAVGAFAAAVVVVVEAAGREAGLVRPLDGASTMADST